MSRFLIWATLAAALMLLPKDEARATLVTLQIDSVMTLGCGPCDGLGFEEDTGFVIGGGSYDVLARLTIDTEVQQTVEHGSAIYRFDQPGTGMSVTVGRLTYFYDAFSVELNGSDGCGDQLFVYSGLVGPQHDGSLFNTSNCPFGPRLADYSLTSFIAGLSGFAGTTFDTFTRNPNRLNAWWLRGGVDRIAVVPEPGSIGLLALCLTAILLTLRNGPAKGMS